MTNVAVVEGRIYQPFKLAKTETTGRSVVTLLLVNNPKGIRGSREFIWAEAWDTTAENICKYLKLGDRLTVIGYLHSKRYEDPMNRAKDKYQTLISVTDVSFGENRFQKESKEAEKELRKLKNKEITENEFDC